MKRGAPDHWKMAELARVLKVPDKYGLAWANGTMERLWHYTAKYHPRGDIGLSPNWAIASACGWNCSKRADRPGMDTASIDAFIAALLTVGWLDLDAPLPVGCRLLVHDWAEHADSYVKKMLKENGLSFFSPTKIEVQNDVPLPSLPLPSLPLPSNARAPVAADLNGSTSQRFPEWFATWEKARGNAYREQAARQYISCVTVELEADALECARSYCAGPGSDVTHGYRPDNFLREMAGEKFRTRWPEANGNRKKEPELSPDLQRIREKLRARQ